MKRSTALRGPVWLLALAVGAAACGGAAAKATAPSPTSSSARNPGANGVAGKVAAVTGGTLVLSTRQGTSQTVVTSPATVVMKVVTASVSDILPNTTVVVTGPMNPDGSYAATAIVVAPAGGSGGFGGGGGFGAFGGGARARRSPQPGATPSPGATRRPRVAGTVSTIQGSTLYVKNAGGTVVQVNTSAATTVTKTVDAALSDVTVGQNVTVTGPKGANGDYTATRITIGGLGAFGPGGGFGGPGGGPGGGGSPTDTATPATA